MIWWVAGWGGCFTCGCVRAFRLLRWVGRGFWFSGGLCDVCLVTDAIATCWLDFLWG